jgi:hypothetical protein
MHSAFMATFIDNTANGLLLKEDYIDGENITLDPNFVTTFIAGIEMVKKDIMKKKNIFSVQDGTQSDSQIVDSYSLLITTLESFDIFVSMFNNYPKYLNDFHLSESSRLARGILIEKEDIMSKEIAQAYLKNFNNLDITTLQIANNFQKDGFYEVQVTILGSIFTFKLWNQNHMIADISYIDTF